MSKMLDRFFGGCGCDEGFGGVWWIIILFFLFVAFGEGWCEIDIMSWIPFLIVLLILCSCESCFN